MTHLSVIIPAYNEAKAIQAGKLTRVRDWLAQQAYPSELIVVDDGSQDDTAALAGSLADTLRIEHAGKAAAIVAGIQHARGEYVLFTDMDQATPIGEAPALLARLGNGAEVAIGSRGLSRPGAPPARYLLSWGQMALRTLLLGVRLTDTQCGFKAFRRDAALAVLENLRLYHPQRLSALQGPSVTSGFDVEFLFVAHRLGFTIREVPVSWNYQETRRVKIIRDMARGIRDLARIAYADLRGQYPKRKPGFTHQNQSD